MHTNPVHISFAGQEGNENVLQRQPGEQDQACPLHNVQGPTGPESSGCLKLKTGVRVLAWQG